MAVMQPKFLVLIGHPNPHPGAYQENLNGKGQKSNSP